MSKTNDRHLVNVHSELDVNGNKWNDEDVVAVAKAPSAEDLVYGEFAINNGKGYETVFIKNSNNEVIPLPNNIDIDILTNEYNQHNESLGFNENGEYTPDGNDTYIAQAETVTDALDTLDNAIKGLSDDNVNINTNIEEIEQDLFILTSATTRMNESVGLNQNIRYIPAANILQGQKNIVDAVDYLADLITALNERVKKLEGKESSTHTILYTATSKLHETTTSTNSGLHTNAFNTTITSHDFSDNAGEIVFDDTVTEIGNYAFYNSTSMTSIEIPKTVTFIESAAFENCTSLANVVIPKSLTGIGANVFGGCRSLISVIYDGTISQWNAISKGNDWKYNVPDNCVVHCTDGDTSI